MCEGRINADRVDAPQMGETWLTIFVAVGGFARWALLTVPINKREKKA